MHPLSIIFHVSGCLFDMRWPCRIDSEEGRWQRSLDFKLFVLKKQMCVCPGKTRELLVSSCRGIFAGTLWRAVSTKFHRHHNVSCWFSVITFSGSCVYVFQKAGEDEVLQPAESLETKSLGSKVFSMGQSSESTKTFSRSEHGELKSCPPEPNQDDTSTANAG